MIKMQDISLTSDSAEHFGILNAFLHHHVHELEPIKMCDFLKTQYMLTKDFYQPG